MLPIPTLINHENNHKKFAVSRVLLYCHYSCIRCGITCITCNSIFQPPGIPKKLLPDCSMEGADHTHTKHHVRVRRGLLATNHVAAVIVCKQVLTADVGDLQGGHDAELRRAAHTRVSVLGVRHTQDSRLVPICQPSPCLGTRNDG